MDSDGAIDALYRVAKVDVSSWDTKKPHTLTYVIASPDGTETDRTSLTVHIKPSPSDQRQVNNPSQPPAATPSATLPPASTNNPNADIALYVDPNNPAVRQANEWRSSRPADAALMDKLAAQPQAKWLGGWNGNVREAVHQYITSASGKLPVIVLYNIPHKHCNSGGGAAGYSPYVTWIQQVADGINGRRTLVILEPDALAMIGCLSPAEQEIRYQSLSKAVDILKTSSNTTVYIDAGHGRWTAANLIAERLFKANIAKADGFSLNVANFITTDINVSYGTTLSDKLNGHHFVVDTSRNGLGPTANNEWCNPLGRAAGPKPTTSVDKPRVDAYLWIKVLGESDGTCNGGPSAGQWWADYALGLMQRADW